MKSYQFFIILFTLSGLCFPFTAKAKVSSKELVVTKGIANAKAITENALANQSPVCSIGKPVDNVSILAGTSIRFVASATDADNDTLTFNWSINTGANTPYTTTMENVDAVRYSTPGNFSALLSVIDGNGGQCQAQVNVQVEPRPPISINSTSDRSSSPILTPVNEQPRVPSSIYRIFAANDLGMHCTDLDARISSILPPFQVMLAQVIQKNGTSKPTLNPPGIELFYSATHNNSDPILSQTDNLTGLTKDGDTFKTNFWNVVAFGAYDSFYPPLVTPLLTGPFPVTQDQSLPVPNSENLFIGSDGMVDTVGGSNDGELTAVQHPTPGISDPYQSNAPQRVAEFYENKPFFVNLPLGYVANKVNWYEGAGIPLGPFDDFGRANPYPLFRVQAKLGANVVTTSDVVLPVSAEASCIGCHLPQSDPAGPARRSSAPLDQLTHAGLMVATRDDDPDKSLPTPVSDEYAADINILRLHDLKHGLDYVDTANQAAPCDIVGNKPNGGPTCLSSLALEQNKPIVCQSCHYTPALDLAQAGPLAGASGSDANGRNQLAHQSNSRVMHNHHGQFTDLFESIPAAIQDPLTGVITNQEDRLSALANNCYQCHPGKETQCLRGAMFNGGVLCSDCHGSMTQIGDDFSKNVSTSNPGAFLLAKDFYTNPETPRVPWANEPGCGSCHTGHATNNLAGSGNVLVNTIDSHGNVDGIRLRQAFRTNDPKAKPIVPTNKIFAEPAIPASFNGFINPGAGNPKLYRVSTGHGGVMCEGCHGSTHAEWPVADVNANDNVIAKQLQGHVGTISECTACHATSALPANTQGGPHGMHLVNDPRFWMEAHKDAAKAENLKPHRGTCGGCHSENHLGSPLSKVPVNRNFLVEGTVRTVRAGQPVACNLCHSLSKSFGN